MSAKGQKRVFNAATTLVSLSSNQQPIRIIFEPHAREAARTHCAQHTYHLEGGVGVSNALGSDVRDAVAVQRSEISQIRHRVAFAVVRRGKLEV